MKVFHGIESYDSNDPTAITTGTFDGVHIGHRKILDRLNDEARKINGRSVLVTFSPHPRIVLFPDSDGPLLLTTLEERLEVLERSGLDAVIVHPFSKEFSRLPAMNYVRDLLVEQLNMKRLVIGYDHHFGRNREGSIEALREMAPVFGFEVTEIPPQDIDDVNVSSTKIRKALQEGDVQTATGYLDYPFFLTGKVIKGHQRGRDLGFPTANLDLENRWKLVPPKGVYAVRVEVAGAHWDGMLNIGVNPTFGAANALSIEVHLLDFEGDLYGKRVRLHFVTRLRDELKFDSVQQLVDQMKNDRIHALRCLRP